jgi:hypothetical protein
MRKYKPPPRASRTDKRNADEFIRDWADSVGSVLAAERIAGLYRGHLHVYFSDPDRRLNPDTALKLSRAAGIPCEALMFRWTPIKDLDMWKWLEACK